MWQLHNHTPFPAFGGFERDKNARASWTVWLKATFRMRHEHACLFDPDQIELCREPLFLREANVSELLSDIDITPAKPVTDIVVIANGHAPRGHREDQPYSVEASIGRWTKALSVHPPMQWGRDLRPQRVAGDEAPVALGYSNAYGGADAVTDPSRPRHFAMNPIGAGYFTSREAAIGRRLPRLLPKGTVYDNWRDELPYDAFTPISRAWPQRVELAGTYDRMWRRKKSPLLPDDFQETYWQSVPENQRVQQKDIAGASIRLTNMCPHAAGHDGSVFETQLPSLDIECFTRFRGKWVESEMRLQTLHIAAETGRLSLVYCAEMPILAAANDVLVEKTDLALRAHSGFRVRPDDLPRFNSSEDEAA